MRDKLDRMIDELEGQESRAKERLLACTNNTAKALERGKVEAYGLAVAMMYGFREDWQAED